MSPTDWRTWPALDGLGRTRRWRLHSAQRRSTQPDALPCLYWSAGDGHRAGRVGDARHELAWENPTGLPAALGALALLGRVAGLADGAPDTDAPLSALDTHIDELALAARIDAGCRRLGGCIGHAALGRAYAGVLAGQRACPLPVDPGLLDAAALAVLLLPLPRGLADGLSLCLGAPGCCDRHPLVPGADPADWRWLLVGPATGGPLADAEPTPAQYQEGARLATALLGDAAPATVAPAWAPLAAPAAAPAWEPLDPPPAALRPLEPLAEPEPRPAVVVAPPPAAVAPVSAPPGSSAALPPRPAPAGLRTLRLWGAASSGKTAYLAQLFTRYHHGGDPAWAVRLPPGVNQAWFEKRLAGFEEQNRFPEPTPAGASDQVNYWLVNAAAGRRAMIAVEDRPGRDYETFDAETARRLAAADGLVLLLDPLRDPATQNEEVTRGLLAMQQARGSAEPDPRPLALCVSKCDALIHSVEDLRRATEQPAAFLERHIGRTISEAVGHYFEHHRVFALSAAGLRVVHGAVLPAVFHDEHLALRISRAGVPLNLLAPLLWLLDEIEA